MKRLSVVRRSCVAVIIFGAVAFRTAAKPEDETLAKNQTPALTIDEVARAAAAIPVASFFENSAVNSLRISPDGARIAFLVPYEGRRALAVFDRKSGEARLVLRATNESFDECEWKGDEHLIAYADYHGSRDYEAVLTDLSGKHVVNLNREWGFSKTLMGHDANERGNWIVVDPRPFDPRQIVAEYWNGIYLLDIFNGSRRLLLNLPGGETHYDYGWRVDVEGRVRTFFRLKDRRISLLYRAGRDGQVGEIGSWARDDFIGNPPADAMWLSGDGQTLYVISRKEHDRGALYPVDLADGKWGAALFVPPEGEIVSLIHSPDRMRLEGVSYEGDRLHYHWFDAGRQRLQVSLEAAFPGREVEVDDVSPDEQIAVVRVYSDREPGSYFIVDRKAGKVDLFKRELLKVEPQLMRPMEPFTFKARDGLELHAYLTRPWLSAKGPVPLVVHPHGGPFGIRDSWGFDREVQFLASRGYAVVQVNFRGSGGYGSDFVSKGRYQWGRAMQDDLTDAVQFLIKAGTADPKRIAIFGASYGGYAALAGAELTPELYCCAVNYLGPADLEITGHRRGDDAYSPEYYYDFRDGWIGPDKAYRAATSPVELVDRIRVPTLHAYGDNDPIIEKAQWERLRRKLTDAKKDFEFFIEKDQGHGFDTGEASIEFYQKLEAFFAKHLAPPPH
jgi:dipeptidyl aminopeptidase/acylaminoacyl peptidase